MSKWLVIGYDEIYGGGIGNKEDWACLTGDYKDACHLGYLLSAKVVCLSPDIFNALKKKAERRYNRDSKAYEMYLQNLVQKDIVFEVHQLNDNTPINLFDYDNDNWELILKDYEVKNISA